MNDFKGRHFGGEIVLWAVRWTKHGRGLSHSCPIGRCELADIARR